MFPLFQNLVLDNKVIRGLNWVDEVGILEEIGILGTCWYKHGFTLCDMGSILGAYRFSRWKETRYKDKSFAGVGTKNRLL